MILQQTNIRENNNVIQGYIWTSTALPPSFIEAVLEAEWKLT